MAKILITGAGSGIGRATARAFLVAGWQVALMGRREAPLRETAGDHPALILPGDVTKPEDVDRVFAQLEAEWGRLDCLFNNAGIMLKGAPIDEIAVEDWLALSSANITGMFLCARAAFGLMRRQAPQGGRIINNGSISAHTPRPGSVPYTMSKHAVTGLTKTLAVDGRRTGDACCPCGGNRSAYGEPATEREHALCQHHGAGYAMARAWLRTKITPLRRPYRTCHRPARWCG